MTKILYFFSNIRIIWIIIGALIHFKSISTEVLPTGVVTDDFDFDGLPGVHHEFRINIKPGIEECFYQNIRVGAELHVTFNVLKGADKNIDIVIKEPNGYELGKRLWTNKGSFDKKIEKSGIYSICIDNSSSRFASKLVYIYLMTYAVQEWMTFTTDLSNFEDQIGNVTTNVDHVRKWLLEIRKMQVGNMQYGIKDWFQLKNINSYVLWFSMSICITIVISGSVQVYFIRRLFKNTTGKPTTMKANA